MIKKIKRNHGVLVYIKSLMSEHRKNYILRDINYYVKMSVSTLVSSLPNFMYALVQKLETLRFLEIVGWEYQNKRSHVDFLY